MNDGTYDDPHVAHTASGQAPNQREEGVGELLSRLTQQGAHLAQEQVSLVQAEMREGVADIKEAVGALVGAAVVGIAALGVILMGLGLWLGIALNNDGLGVLIVGLIAGVIAFIMYSGAKKKVSATNLKPSRTIRTAEDTPAAMTGHMTSPGGTNER
jgi:hypothetical protein